MGMTCQTNMARFPKLPCSLKRTFQKYEYRRLYRVLTYNQCTTQTEQADWVALRIIFENPRRQGWTLHDACARLLILILKGPGMRVLLCSSYAVTRGYLQTANKRIRTVQYMYTTLMRAEACTMPRSKNG